MSALWLIRIHIVLFVDVSWSHFLWWPELMSCHKAFNKQTTAAVSLGLGMMNDQSRSAASCTEPHHHEHLPSACLLEQSSGEVIVSFLLS